MDGTTDLAGLADYVYTINGIVRSDQGEQQQTG